ncbi:hypothetical protein [Candidatus Binatus sp.]|uniref:hypothetical protein n=1 Tax=Candidatus Binatus sp. TaxID=2811406 RepID=UPI00272999E8|nr:hypothetical protein [Candidatus Binatus sp.]
MKLVQELVDGMRMKSGFSTGSADCARARRSSRRFTDNFSAAEVRAKSIAWPSHKQIHNSYGYC